MKKRGPILAYELKAQLEADPEFMARKAERDRFFAEKAERLRIEGEPIVRDLKEVGWEVKSVWDMVNSPGPYPEAIPVLLKHLLLPYSDRTREGLARSLAVYDACHLWPILVQEYLKAPLRLDNGKDSLAKDGLAVALAATVRENTIDELVTIAKDPANGGSRILFLRALRKSKSPIAKQALEDLANDPATAKEIASWKKRKRTK